MNMSNIATKYPVCLAAYGGFVGIGKTNPATALDVTGDITVSSQVIKPLVTYIASATNLTISSAAPYEIVFNTPTTTPTYSYFSYNATTGIFTNVSGRKLSVFVTLDFYTPPSTGAPTGVCRRTIEIIGIARHSMIFGNAQSAQAVCTYNCSGGANIANNGTIQCRSMQELLTGSVSGCSATITIQILN
jgi:hypothetical protein